MAGQAGWYRAPGEDGLLRYWNGTTWTAHRQPDPAAGAAPAPGVADVEPDPMAEYERQFESSSPFDPHGLDLPSFNLDQRSFDSPAPVAERMAPESAPSAAPERQPVFGAQTAPSPSAPAHAHEFAGVSTSVPRSFAPAPAPTEFAPLGPMPLALVSVQPIALPASFEPTTTVAIPGSELVRMPRQPETIVVAAPVARREPLAIAGPVSASVVVPPDLRRVRGAARGMWIAVVVILLGIGAMAFFSVQSLAGPGQAKTNGIVTSLGSTAGNSCTPIARFAVNGRSLTAGAQSAITPCPVGLGQSVDIIYSSANPASAAQIRLGSSPAQYLWIVPVLGFFFLLGSLIAFIVRAGSLVSGIRLLRSARKQPGKLTRPAEPATRN